MRTPRGRPTPAVGTLWIGKVKRVLGDGRAVVTVERLKAGHEYTCRIVLGTWTAGLTTEGATAGTAHTHGLGADLAPGHEVLCGVIEGDPDRLVVLGRL